MSCLPSPLSSSLFFSPLSFPRLCRLKSLNSKEVSIPPPPPGSLPHTLTSSPTPPDHSSPLTWPTYLLASSSLQGGPLSIRHTPPSSHKVVCNYLPGLLGYSQALVYHSITPLPFPLALCTLRLFILPSLRLSIVRYRLRQLDFPLTVVRSLFSLLPGRYPPSLLTSPPPPSLLTSPPPPYPPLRLSLLCILLLSRCHSP